MHNNNKKTIAVDVAESPGAERDDVFHGSSATEIETLTNY